MEGLMRNPFRRHTRDPSLDCAPLGRSVAVLPAVPVAQGPAHAEGEFSSIHSQTGSAWHRPKHRPSESWYQMPVGFGGPPSLNGVGAHHPAPSGSAAASPAASKAAAMTPARGSLQLQASPAPNSAPPPPQLSRSMPTSHPSAAAPPAATPPAARQGPLAAAAAAASAAALRQAAAGQPPPKQQRPTIMVPPGEVVWHANPAASPSMLHSIPEGGAAAQQQGFPIATQAPQAAEALPSTYQQQQQQQQQKLGKLPPPPRFLRRSSLGPGGPESGAATDRTAARNSAGEAVAGGSFRQAAATAAAAGGGLAAPAGTPMEGAGAAVGPRHQQGPGHGVQLKFLSNLSRGSLDDEHVTEQQRQQQQQQRFSNSRDSVQDWQQEVRQPEARAMRGLQQAASHAPGTAERLAVRPPAVPAAPARGAGARHGGDFAHQEGVSLQQQPMAAASAGFSQGAAAPDPTSPLPPVHHNARVLPPFWGSPPSPAAEAKPRGESGAAVARSPSQVAPPPPPPPHARQAGHGPSMHPAAGAAAAHNTDLAGQRRKGPPAPPPRPPPPFHHAPQPASTHVAAQAAAGRRAGPPAPPPPPPPPPPGSRPTGNSSNPNSRQQPRPDGTTAGTTASPLQGPSRHNQQQQAPPPRQAAPAPSASPLSLIKPEQLLAAAGRLRKATDTPAGNTPQQAHGQDAPSRAGAAARSTAAVGTAAAAGGGRAGGGGGTPAAAAGVDARDQLMSAIRNRQFQLRKVDADVAAAAAAGKAGAARGATIGRSQPAMAELMRKVAERRAVVEGGAGSESEDESWD